MEHLPTIARYIVIRNDQHAGSTHRAKIFIVAGNRPMTPQKPPHRQIQCVINIGISMFFNIDRTTAAGDDP